MGSDGAHAHCVRQSVLVHNTFVVRRTSSTPAQTTFSRAPEGGTILKQGDSGERERAFKRCGGGRSAAFWAIDVGLSFSKVSI